MKGSDPVSTYCDHSNENFDGYENQSIGVILFPKLKLKETTYPTLHQYLDKGYNFGPKNM